MIKDVRLFFENSTRILFLFVPLSIPMISLSSPENAVSLGSVSVLSTSSLHLILILLGALSVISGIIISFSIKLRKVNRELKERNSEILEINENLQRTNKQLTEQKENITKEHYESDKFYGMLFKSADDGISFYDRSWNLKYANSAFYSMVGLDPKTYNSIDPDELIHPDDTDYSIRKIQSLTSKGFFESELRLRHNNGYYINLSARSVTVRSDTGEILGSLTISRDITRMKQVHNDLVKANSQAEASNRLKTSFLANISHEIRTPLNSVVGFSNLLLSDDLTKEAKEEYIGHINYNSEKLIQIIGDIIDLSRLESSQIEIRYEETSLNSLVSEIVNETKQIIRRNEKSIILKVTNLFKDNGDLIFTDRMWLKRVLNHLMDNAVKFTLDGSVELIYMLENDQLVFKVKDTGIGINKENLTRIFEEFRQEIDGHHRPFEGLGVGLTLAKEVVERMGGKIFVQSEKGIGSEFGFSLPYRPAGSTRIRAKENIEQTTVHYNWISRKCLLVDDNKDVLIYLRKLLTDTGISILTARSGFEAIQLIQNTHDIDLVILDMQMPEMNGIEATREIRKISKKVPIIAQTAFIFEDDKDIILEAGCDACLIKPVRKEHLLTTMAGFLKK